MNATKPLAHCRHETHIFIHVGGQYICSRCGNAGTEEQWREQLSSPKTIAQEEAVYPRNFR